MERLFIIIKRINSVLFLLVLLGAAGLIAFLTLKSSRWQPRGAVEVAASESGTNKPILLNFERVESITGTDTQMMRLSAQRKSGKFSSGGYGSETRNVLFLNGSEKVARWLFKDHKNLILASNQLHEKSAESKEISTKALYFEYVSEDTNKDGNLSAEDHSNVGLTKPDGTGFLVVLHDVNRVLSFQILDQQHLSIVYQKETVVKHAKFSVATMTLISDQEIVNVPSTL
jgi:hypothetical protein